ncbi:ABC transporter substrate-binding protein [Nocardioides limicola]|uniref:ABC transporter substrate-binding protein n=1 Tax=Nocardioides limicola TaxID=2803368 RepID=UPI00193BFD1A|nr:ABC transporter substrate-binding protein [Nocardioides sp. DJM-14]
MKTQIRRAAVIGAVAALVLTGCGRGTDAEEGDVPGVTSEPCPEAIDDSKGCIYLGTVSDFTGVFSPVGIPMTAGAQAFWDNVNQNGGIGDYEVDTTTHVRDSGYDTTRHAQLFREIRDDVLAIAHSLGTAHTNGILEDAREDDIVVLPASLGSNWLFEDGVVHVGTSYCAEAMNVVDFAVDQLGATSVGVVHFPGDYGDDAAVGAAIAAEARDIEIFDYTTGPGGVDEQTAVISGILRDQPDVVLIATSAVETAAVVGATAQQGFRGAFIGSLPSWSGALLGTPAAPALEAMFMHASSIGAWDADTPGHDELRAYAEANDVEPNDWFGVGWAGGHAMKALLEKAIADDKLTRSGLVETLGSLTGVDSMGMLPADDGNYAGDSNERAPRTTFINRVDPDSATGLTESVPAFTGPTVADYEFTSACYSQR